MKTVESYINPELDDKKEAQRIASLPTFDFDENTSTDPKKNKEPKEKLSEEEEAERIAALPTIDGDIDLNVEVPTQYKANLERSQKFNERALLEFSKDHESDYTEAEQRWLWDMQFIKSPEEINEAVDVFDNSNKGVFGGLYYFDPETFQPVPLDGTGKIKPDPLAAATFELFGANFMDRFTLGFSNGMLEGAGIGATIGAAAAGVGALPGALGGGAIGGVLLGSLTAIYGDDIDWITDGSRMSDRVKQGQGGAMLNTMINTMNGTTTGLAALGKLASEGIVGNETVFSNLYDSMEKQAKGAETRINPLIPQEFQTEEAWEDVASFFNGDNYNMDALPVMIGQGAASMIQFISIGGAIGAALKGAGKLGLKSAKKVALKQADELKFINKAKAAYKEGDDVLGDKMMKAAAKAAGVPANARAAQFMAGMIINNQEIMQSIDDAEGMSVRERAAYGITATMGMAAIEMLGGPDAAFLRGMLRKSAGYEVVTGGIAKEIKKQAGKGLTSKGLKSVYDKAYLSTFKQVQNALYEFGVKGALSEGLEEAMQGAWQDIAKKGANYLYELEGEDAYHADMATPEAWTEYFNSFVGGMVVGGPGSTFRANKAARIKSAITMGDVVKSQKNQASFIQRMEVYAQKGYISEEEKNIALEQLDKFSRYEKATKDVDLSRGQKKEAFVYMNEIDHVKKELQNLPEGSAASAALQDQLKGYESKLKTLLDSAGKADPRKEKAAKKAQEKAQAKAKKEAKEEAQKETSENNTETEAEIENESEENPVTTNEQEESVLGEDSSKPTLVGKEAAKAKILANKDAYDLVPGKNEDGSPRLQEDGSPVMEYYDKEGNRLRGITSLLGEMRKPFDNVKRAIASVKRSMSQLKQPNIDAVDENHPLVKEELEKYKKQNQEGTATHKLAEDIVNGKKPNEIIAEAEKAGMDKDDLKELSSTVAEIEKFVGKLKAEKKDLLTEIPIVDESTGMVMVVDLMAVKPDGSVEIYDFKVKGRGKGKADYLRKNYKDDDTKAPETYLPGSALEGIERTSAKDYAIQLKMAARALRDQGIRVTATKIVPIEGDLTTIKPPGEAKDQSKKIVYRKKAIAPLVDVSKDASNAELEKIAKKYDTQRPMGLRLTPEEKAANEASENPAKAEYIGKWSKVIDFIDSFIEDQKKNPSENQNEFGSPILGALNKLYRQSLENEAKDSIERKRTVKDLSAWAVHQRARALRMERDNKDSALIEVAKTEAAAALQFSKDLENNVDKPVKEIIGSAMAKDFSEFNDIDISGDMVEGASEYSVANELTRIIATNSRLAPLAKTLLDISKRLKTTIKNAQGKGALGRTDIEQNGVQFAADVMVDFDALEMQKVLDINKYDVTDEIILHEEIHRYTLALFLMAERAPSLLSKEEQKFVAVVNDIYNQYQALGPDVTGKFPGIIGAHELLAYGLTDVDVIQELSRHKLKTTTILEKLINAIKTLFGRNATMYEGLDQVFTKFMGMNSKNVKNIQQANIFTPVPTFRRRTNTGDYLKDFPDSKAPGESMVNYTERVSPIGSFDVNDILYDVYNNGDELVIWNPKSRKEVWKRTPYPKTISQKSNNSRRNKLLGTAGIINNQYTPTNKAGLKQSLASKVAPKPAQVAEPASDIIQAVKDGSIVGKIVYSEKTKNYGIETEAGQIIKIGPLYENKAPSVGTEATLMFVPYESWNPNGQYKQKGTGQVYGDKIEVIDSATGDRLGHVAVSNNAAEQTIFEKKPATEEADEADTTATGSEQETANNQGSKEIRGVEVSPTAKSILDQIKGSIESSLSSVKETEATVKAKEQLNSFVSKIIGSAYHAGFGSPEITMSGIYTFKKLTTGINKMSKTKAIKKSIEHMKALAAEKSIEVPENVYKTFAIAATNVKKNFDVNDMLQTVRDEEVLYDTEMVDQVQWDTIFGNEQLKSDRFLNNNKVRMLYANVENHHPQDVMDELHDFFHGYGKKITDPAAALEEMKKGSQILIDFANSIEFHERQGQFVSLMASVKSSRKRPFLALFRNLKEGKLKNISEFRVSNRTRKTQQFINQIVSERRQLLEFNGFTLAGNENATIPQYKNVLSEHYAKVNKLNQLKNSFNQLNEVVTNPDGTKESLLITPKGTRITAKSLLEVQMALEIELIEQLTGVPANVLQHYLNNLPKTGKHETYIDYLMSIEPTPKSFLVKQVNGRDELYTKYKMHLDSTFIAPYDVDTNSFVAHKDFESFYNTLSKNKFAKGIGESIKNAGYAPRFDSVTGSKKTSALLDNTIFHSLENIMEVDRSTYHAENPFIDYYVNEKKSAVPVFLGDGVKNVESQEGLDGNDFISDEVSLIQLMGYLNDSNEMVYEGEYLQAMKFGDKSMTMFIPVKKHANVKAEVEAIRNGNHPNKGYFPSKAEMIASAERLTEQIESWAAANLMGGNNNIYAVREDAINLAIDYVAQNAVNRFWTYSYMYGRFDNYAGARVNEKTANVVNVADGIKVIKNGITAEEETELFNELKPLLESQGSKTLQSASAPIMIGLGLRWDYTSNNPGKTPVELGKTIHNSPYQKNKYRYYDVAHNGQPLGQISQRLKDLVTKATGIDASNYDGAIINVYPKNSFISAHNDVDESATAIKYPVLVLNIGGDGSLSVEGAKSQQAKKGYAQKEYTNTVLNSGDAYVFGENGTNRDVYHRTLPSSGKGTLPELNIQGQIIPANSYRITITMRRVKPLEAGMPKAPNASLNETSKTTAAPVNRKKAVLGMVKRGSSFASGGIAPILGLKGGLTQTYNQVIVPDTKLTLALNNDGVLKQIGKDNDYENGDGILFQSERHESQVNVSFGSAYDYKNSLKPVVAYVDKNGNPILDKLHRITLTKEMVEMNPKVLGPIYEAMNNEDSPVDTIVFTSGAKLYEQVDAEGNPFDALSKIEYNPDGTIKSLDLSKATVLQRESKHLRVQQDLNNDGKVKNKRFIPQMLRHLKRIVSHNASNELLAENTNTKIADFNHMYSSIKNEQQKRQMLINVLKKQTNTENIIELLEFGVPVEHEMIAPYLKTSMSNIYKKNVADINTKGALLTTISDNWLPVALKGPRIENGKFLPGEAYVPADSGIEINEEFFVTRVPADDLHSMSKVIAVGYLPASMGNKIALSKEDRALAGEDLDGDQRHIWTKDKTAKYLEKGSAQANTELVRQNKYRAQVNALFALFQDEKGLENEFRHFLPNLEKIMEGGPVFEYTPGDNMNQKAREYESKVFDHLLLNAKLFEPAYSMIYRSEQASSEMIFGRMPYKKKFTNSEEAIANQLFDQTSAAYNNVQNFDAVTNPVDIARVDPDLKPDAIESLNLFLPDAVSVTHDAVKSTTGENNVIGIVAKVLGTFVELSGNQLTVKENPLNADQINKILERMGDALNQATDNLKNLKLERMNLNNTNAGEWMTLAVMGKSVKEIIEFFEHPEIKSYYQTFTGNNYTGTSNKLRISDIKKTAKAQKRDQTAKEKEMIEVLTISQELFKLGRLTSFQENGIKSLEEYFEYENLSLKSDPKKESLIKWSIENKWGDNLDHSTAVAAKASNFNSLITNKKLIDFVSNARYKLARLYSFQKSQVASIDRMLHDKLRYEAFGPKIPSQLYQEILQETKALQGAAVEIFKYIGFEKTSKGENIVAINNALKHSPEASALVAAQNAFKKLPLTLQHKLVEYAAKQYGMSYSTKSGSFAQVISAHRHRDYGKLMRKTVAKSAKTLTDVTIEDIARNPGSMQTFKSLGVPENTKEPSVWEGPAYIIDGNQQIWNAYRREALTTSDSYIMHYTPVGYVSQLGKRPEATIKGQAEANAIPSRKGDVAMAEKISAELAKAFPGVKVFKDSQKFLEFANKHAGGVFNESHLGKLGSAFKNAVLINESEARQDTEIHEYGHVYFDAMDNDHAAKRKLVEAFGMGRIAEAEELAITAVGIQGYEIMQARFSGNIMVKIGAALRNFWSQAKALFGKANQKDVARIFAKEMLDNRYDIRIDSEAGLKNNIIHNMNVHMANVNTEAYRNNLLADGEIQEKLDMLLQNRDIDVALSELTYKDVEAIIGIKLTPEQRRQRGLDGTWLDDMHFYHYGTPEGKNTEVEPRESVQFKEEKDQNTYDQYLDEIFRLENELKDPDLNDQERQAFQDELDSNKAFKEQLENMHTVMLYPRGPLTKQAFMEKVFPHYKGMAVDSIPEAAQSRLNLMYSGTDNDGNQVKNSKYYLNEFDQLNSEESAFGMHLATGEAFELFVEENGVQGIKDAIETLERGYNTQAVDFPIKILKDRLAKEILLGMLREENTRNYKSRNIVTRGVYEIFSDDTAMGSEDWTDNVFDSGTHSLRSPSRLGEAIMQLNEQLIRENIRQAQNDSADLNDVFKRLNKGIKDAGASLDALFYEEQDADTGKVVQYFHNEESAEMMEMREAARNGDAKAIALLEFFDKHVEVEKMTGEYSWDNKKKSYRVPQQEQDIFEGLFKGMNATNKAEWFRMLKDENVVRTIQSRIASKTGYDNLAISEKNLAIDFKKYGLSGTESYGSIKAAIAASMSTAAGTARIKANAKALRDMKTLQKYADALMAKGIDDSGAVTKAEGLSKINPMVGFEKTETSTKNTASAIARHHEGMMFKKQFQHVEPIMKFLENHQKEKGRHNMGNWLSMHNAYVLYKETPKSWAGKFDKSMDALAGYTYFTMLGGSWTGAIFNSMQGFVRSLTDMRTRNMLTGMGRIYKSFLTSNPTKMQQNNTVVSMLKKFDIVSVSKDTEMNITQKSINTVSNYVMANIVVAEYINHAYSFFGEMTKEEYGRIEQAIKDNPDISRNDLAMIMGGLEPGELATTEQSEKDFALKKGNWRIDQLQERTQQINGAYSQTSKRRILQTPEGRWAMMFKGWLPELLLAHVSPEVVDMYGQNRKGMITSALDAMRSKEGWKEMAYVMNPLGTPQDKFNKLSPTDQNNIRRLIKEALMIGAMALAYAGLKGDDDDKLTDEQKTMAKIMQRMLKETAMFYDADSYLDVLKSPFPVISSIENLVRMSTQVFLWDVYDTSGATYEKGDIKFFHYVQKNTPVVNQGINSYRNYKDIGTYLMN